MSHHSFIHFPTTLPYQLKRFAFSCTWSIPALGLWFPPSYISNTFIHQSRFPIPTLAACVFLLYASACIGNKVYLILKTKQKEFFPNLCSLLFDDFFVILRQIFKITNQQVLSRAFFFLFSFFMSVFTRAQHDPVFFLSYSLALHTSSNLVLIA